MTDQSGQSSCPSYNDHHSLLRDAGVDRSVDGRVFVLLAALLRGHAGAPQLGLVHGGLSEVVHVVIGWWSDRGILIIVLKAQFEGVDVVIVDEVPCDADVTANAVASTRVVGCVGLPRASAHCGLVFGRRRVQEVESNSGVSLCHRVNLEVGDLVVVGGDRG